MELSFSLSEVVGKSLSSTFTIEYFRMRPGSYHDSVPVVEMSAIFHSLPRSVSLITLLYM